MRSVRLQFLATLAATAIAAGWLTYRGLPPTGTFSGAIRDGDAIQARRCLLWRIAWEKPLPRVSLPQNTLADPDWWMGYNDWARATPIHCAIAAGHVDLARVLMTTDGGLSRRDGIHGHPPMFWAANRGDVEMLSALLDCGADIDAKDTFGHSVIFAAMYAPERHHEALEWVLAHGAEVNTRDGESGNTPLHLACFMQDTDAVTLLLAHGADVNARNNEGLTPLEMCAGRDRSQVVVKLLRERGATE